MTTPRQDLPRRWLYCLLLVLLEIFVTAEASGAANKATDVKMVVTPEGRHRLVMILQQKPRYQLSWGAGKEGSLSLFDTAGGAGFAKAVAKQGKTVRLEEKQPENALKLTIVLKSPPREVECSWIAKDKAFLIDLIPAKEAGGKMPNKNTTRTLHALRFGPQQGFTRMVADLSARPAWGITFRDEQSVLFNLIGTSSAVKRTSYGPMKRFRSVTLSEKGHDLEIKADPESPLERVKVSWLKEGGKWVVDCFDRAPETLEASLRFETRTVPEPERAKPSPPPPVQTRKEAGAASQTAKPEPKKDEAPPEGYPGNAATPAEGTGSLVRMKIESSTPADAGPAKPAVQAAKFKPEPKVRYDAPVVLPEGQRVFNLRPAEAFLYGRIREALEVKDYEKGAGLIDEFLAGFPDSILAEDMAFLAGDCRFAMMEKGDKSLAPKVIAAYQDAATKYPKSQMVQTALVRMARAHDLAGNENDAIGLLTVAVNQYGASPEALIARGRTFLRLNQPQRAIEDFKTVISRFPGSPMVQEAKYGIAGYFHGVGMYDEAEAKLKEIADSAPGFYQEHPEFLFLRARNFFYRKNYDLAREQYFKALNLGHQPESGDLLISHIGDTYFHQSREKEAETLYRMAVHYFAESEGAGIAKLRIADQSSSGVSAYEEVYQKNLNRPIGDLALLEMAGKFYKKGQYGLAVETLRRLTGKAVQSDVQREARQLYFRCAEKEIKGYYDKGLHEKVTDYFQTADPPLGGNIEPEMVLLVGDSFYRRQMPAEAARIFSQLAIRELPPASRGKFVINFAKIYLSQGDDDNARTLLEGAAGEKLPPLEQQKAGLLLGEIYQRKGEIKKASDLYQSLLQEKRLLSDREMAGLYLGLGTISNKQSLYEKARDALNRSIALAEKDRESRELLRSAYLEMGNSYHLEGRHQEAIRSYGNCLDLEYMPEMKGYWDVKYRLALSYLGSGESGMAERIMNEIMEEGDPALQQKVQMRMGSMALERELKRLPLGKKGESIL